MLIWFLTGCSGVAPPSSQLVEKALALQLNLAHQQFSQHLGSPPAFFEVKHLQITDTEPLKIEDLPSYHIQGNYNVTVKLPKHQVSQRQNFDVYLQRQIEGKTWRLARRQASHKEPGLFWFTYLIE